MNTIEELKQFLATQNLIASYTSSDHPDMFEILVTPEGIDKQGSYETLPYTAKAWISYNQYSDIFTFCISYFDHSGNAITKETFASQLSHLPVARYDESNERHWVKDGDIYTLQLIENAVVKLGMRTIVPR